MDIVTLIDKDVVYDLHSHGNVTIPAGESIIIYNNANNELYVAQQVAQPSLNSGIPVRQGESISITGDPTKTVWVSGVRGNIVVQKTTEALSAYSRVDLPQDVWTSSHHKTRRLQVDEGQTGFEEGRMHYCLATSTLTAGQSKDYTFIFTTDVIFEASFVTIVSGDILLEVWAGGTDNAGFTTPIAIFPLNSMSEKDSNGYTTGTTKFEGGVYNADGTMVDYLRVKTDSNVNKSVGSESEFLKKLGIPAGQYYFRFTNQSGSAPAEFIIKEVWEERYPTQYS